MGLKKNIIILISFLLVIAIVYAVEQKSYVNINMMNNQIYNVSWVNASYFNGSGQYLTGITGTGNTTAQMQIAINNSGSYNIQCKNSTQVYNSSYDSTYNSTYHNFVIANVSNIAQSCYYMNNATDRTSFLNIFNATYDLQSGHNTTTEIINAINTSGSFNIQCKNATQVYNSTYESTYNVTYHNFVIANVSNIAQSCYYMNNATDRTSFTSTFNSTYNIQSGHNTTTEIINAVNTSGNFNIQCNNATLVYNSSYNLQLGHNTSAEIITVINNSGSYNIQCSNATLVYNSTYDSTYNVTYHNFVIANVSNIAQSCYYMNNATDRTSFLSTYNSTYDAKPSNTYNASYNAQLNHNTTAEIINAINTSGSFNIQCNNATLVYNSSYESTYNVTYHNFVIANVSNQAQNCYYINNATERTALAGVGGSGVNYWQVLGSWMWNNVTAGGQPNINLTTVNATNFYGSGASLTGISTYNATYDAKPSNTYNSSYYLYTNPYGFLNSTYNVTYHNFVTANVSNIAQSCYYMNNATDRTIFLSTYNSTYDAKIDTANTTAEMITAINNSGVFNITSWSTYYMNNATDRTAFTAAYNVTYHNFVVANVSNIAQSCYYVNNATERTSFTSTYNSSYNIQLGHNTSTEIINAINTSGSFNIQCSNATLVYNSTYNAQLGHNTTTEMITAINVSTNAYVFTKIYINTTCLNPSCSRNITDNSTNVIIYG